MNKEPKANGRPLTEIDWVEFDKLCMMLCTQAEIAEWFGCTDDTIQAAVRKKYGVGFSELYKRKSASFRAGEDDHDRAQDDHPYRWLTGVKSHSDEVDEHSCG